MFQHQESSNGISALLAPRNRALLSDVALMSRKGALAYDWPVERLGLRAVRLYGEELPASHPAYQAQGYIVERRILKATPFDDPSCTSMLLFRLYIA